MKHYFSARIPRLLTVAAALTGLTCAMAGDSKKPAATKPAKAAAKAGAARGKTSPRMVVSRDPETGGLSSAVAPITDPGGSQTPVITETLLPNGLRMATSSNGFMTTMTVTKSADGALVYDCKDGHPKGAHTHSAKTGAAKGGAR
ncbi:MAG: hypothetical protein JNL98_16840 [Bryobacterales bacterium]|nr:hypothetical protein [Bryobacterales bacterium]